MKKSVVLILVVVIAFALVIPVAAKGPGPGGNGPSAPAGGGNGTMTAYSQSQQGPRQTFAVVGTIAAIDPALMTLTINVINGNKLIQDSGLDVITVSVVETTRLLRQTGRIGIPITFADLTVGQQVSINGIVDVVTVDEIDNETWTAYRVTVGAYLTQTHKR